MAGSAPRRPAPRAKLPQPRFQFTDGRLRFSYKERVLTCTAYGTYAVPDPAEDEKTLDVRVEAISAAQRTSQGVAALAGS